MSQSEMRETYRTSHDLLSAGCPCSREFREVMASIQEDTIVLSEDRERGEEESDEYGKHNVESMIMLSCFSRL